MGKRTRRRYIPHNPAPTREERMRSRQAWARQRAEMAATKGRR